MLNGVPLIRHTIRALLSEPRVAKVVVVLSPEDTDWHEGCLPDNAAGRVRVIRLGGATRADSVFNGINWLLNQPNVDSSDWVLVHDAARPCLSPTQIEALLTQLNDDPVGGLLAIPVADTVKHANVEDRVDGTVDRRQLWLAQTPQMFRLQLLAQALSTIDPALATDESSAVEALGLQPKLVPGSLSNLKVTYPQDLPLASAILHSTITL